MSECLLEDHLDAYYKQNLVQGLSRDKLSDTFKGMAGRGKDEMESLLSNKQKRRYQVGFYLIVYDKGFLCFCFYYHISVDVKIVRCGNCTYVHDLHFF